MRTSEPGPAVAVRRQGRPVIVVATIVITFMTLESSGASAAPSLSGSTPNARLSTEAATGYWEAAADGGIFSFGTAPFLGSMAGHALNAPIVGMASVAGGRAQYYEVAADGGIFSFGDAPFFGSMGGHHLNAPVVGMALGPDINGGYYEVGSDGGVFAFGNAPFLGSMAGQHLNAPIVGIAVSETALPGYWLVAADGGVFSFGAAPFLGSLAPSQGVSAMAGTITGHGYALLNKNGNVTFFGDAVTGSSTLSPSSVVLNAPAIALVLTNGNYGHWTVAADGGVFTDGEANYLGSMGGQHLNASVVGFGISP